jgi:hypothetical protein
MEETIKMNIKRTSHARKNTWHKEQVTIQRPNNEIPIATTHYR